MVIMAYAANGKTKDAHKVYQQMIASGVTPTPTAYTYTLIISGMAKDFSDSNFVGYAKKYFLEMLDRGMKPQYQPYMYVMDAIAYREPVEEAAKKFLEQIKAKGFIPVIDDFQYKENHLTEALQAMKTFWCGLWDVCHGLRLVSDLGYRAVRWNLRFCSSNSLGRLASSLKSHIQLQRVVGKELNCPQKFEPLLNLCCQLSCIPFYLTLLGCTTALHQQENTMPKMSWAHTYLSNGYTKLPLAIRNLTKD
ncbi:uncharacterized protein LOC133707509 isoform X2 [Rosa rugosa]|nr:uncharacterized protein LOC133707509 isoform X2 [Rosa rugosa]XP_061989068.1 uncharacterized protein LOC133707509 isoform X2 [Rosa rugosa]